MKHPAPTRQDHERFYTTEGWVVRKQATGKSGTHHVNYELTLPDGRILLTRVSHPVDRTTYGPCIWSHIRRDQLSVTEIEFWACVHEGEIPDRGTPKAPAETIPLGVVVVLIDKMHIPEDVVRGMSKDEALAEVIEYYSRLRKSD